MSATEGSEIKAILGYILTEPGVGYRLAAMMD